MPNAQSRMTIRLLYFGCKSPYFLLLYPDNDHEEQFITDVLHSPSLHDFMVPVDYLPRVSGILSFGIPCYGIRDWEDLFDCLSSVGFAIVSSFRSEICRLQQVFRDLFGLSFGGDHVPVHHA